MEYYSAKKRNRVLITYHNMDDPWIMLNIRSQAQKATCYMIPFIWNVRNRQIHRDRTEIVVAKGWGGERMGIDC